MPQQMRVNALGVYRMKGKSKTSGNDYDMAKLVMTKPFEQFANANMVRTGFGLTVAELDMEPDAVNRCATLQFPCEVDLEIGARISDFGKLESIITAVRPVPAAAAARQAA